MVPATDMGGEKEVHLSHLGALFEERIAQLTPEVRRLEDSAVLSGRRGNETFISLLSGHPARDLQKIMVVGRRPLRAAWSKAILAAAFGIASEGAFNVLRGLWLHQPDDIKEGLVFVGAAIVAAFLVSDKRPRLAARRVVAR